MTLLFSLLVAFYSLAAPSRAFMMATPQTTRTRTTTPITITQLHMGLDMVTYLRTEWVSAALCTNQTPRSCDTCLQLGVQDGRIVTFLPRTIREIWTSSCEPDGVLDVSTRRQLKQQQERRNAGKVQYLDQRADDLKLVPDNSMDVVVSLQSAAVMMEKGLDWKKSVREAARVLKPGGRFLFVEQSTLENESYLDYVESIVEINDDDDTSEEERAPLFEVGYDDVDLVIVPHIAGVAIKSTIAGMTESQVQKLLDAQEKAKQDELSIEAFGKKRRKRKKKKKTADAEASA